MYAASLYRNCRKRRVLSVNSTMFPSVYLYGILGKASLNTCLATAWRRAQDRSGWWRIVEMATLHSSERPACDGHRLGPVLKGNLLELTFL